MNVKVVRDQLIRFFKFFHHQIYAIFLFFIGSFTFFVFIFQTVLVKKSINYPYKKLERGNTKTSAIYPVNAELDHQTIFMITPTYSRHTQKADMTRLLYTLLHVPNLHWIIVEDRFA